jgi:hypothetical protein
LLLKRQIFAPRFFPQCFNAHKPRNEKQHGGGFSEKDAGQISEDTP